MNLWHLLFSEYISTHFAATASRWLIIPFKKFNSKSKIRFSQSSLKGWKLTKEADGTTPMFADEFYFQIDESLKISKKLFQPVFLVWTKKKVWANKSCFISLKIETWERRKGSFFQTSSHGRPCRHTLLSLTLTPTHTHYSISLSPISLSHISLLSQLLSLLSSSSSLISLLSLLFTFILSPTSSLLFNTLNSPSSVFSLLFLPPLSLHSSLPLSRLTFLSVLHLSPLSPSLSLSLPPSLSLSHLSIFYLCLEHSITRRYTNK